MIGENARWIMTADVHDDAVEDIDGIARDRFRAGSAECDVRDEVDRAIAPECIELQGPIGGEQTAADVKNSISAQSSRFNDVGRGTDAA